LFWSCFGLVLVLLCSCFALTKENQKETKARQKGNKNKTKAKEGRDSNEISILLGTGIRIVWGICCGNFIKKQVVPKKPQKSNVYLRLIE